MKKTLTDIILTLVATVAFAIAGFAITEPVDANAATMSYDKIHKVAKAQLGKPYGWGSTGPSRFDCSGFTSYVYKKGASKKIPRTAQAQYNKYKHVSYKNIKKGDLVFFGGSKHSISHVGLYVGGGKMIDSQNRGVVTEAVHAPWWHAVGYARVGTVA
ncbi:C40 family peptidase [Levilactobacillus brevis]|jgi:cell wall-associated NlpC family hydrolase|uniref:Cell wall-associated hydrolase n=4 Tax=Levilactobacillus brevis TaxID=1580 RepID=Q03NN6_LEVBA|nr:NlpC/P60 family protein [Levilactobacillus brevis]MBL3537121.1 C40 family peptidase [Lactobacillus sp. GPR40-2]MBL3630279.1 C40 family peptidase [Lactobacillus sp. GPB7-4]ABJ65186.1 Cell wall-associated hydrolase [Levilactobacillus brevis ATCC 367]AJA80531.1 hydrolase [Levilactobacillus brevis BSO 464]ANN47767.1 hydrolase [Levilactobacillus brevis]